MTDSQALTKTLVFPLDVQSGNESLFHDGRPECRRVFNEVLRLTYDGWDWNGIEDAVEQNADLVQNTAQRIIDKAFSTLDNYYDNDDRGRPWYKHETFPLRMNYGEGIASFSKTKRYGSASVRNRTITSKANCAAHKPSSTCSDRR